MSSTVFANGWRIIAGEQPGDILLNDSVSLSGNVAAEFPSTASASATIVTDWIAIDDSTATGVNECGVRAYPISFHVRADDVSANKDVWLGWETTNEAKSSILSSTAIWNTNLPTANTWHVIGDVATGIFAGGARWLRLKAYRPTDIDFSLYLDAVQVQGVPPYWHYTKSAAGAFTAGWSTVALNLLNIKSQSTFSSGLCTIAQPGVYLMTGDISINDDVAAGDVFGVRLSWRRDGAAAAAYAIQSLTIPTGGYSPRTAGEDLGLSVTATAYLDGYNSGNAPGDVRLQVAQSAGSLVNYETARLTVTRIMG